MDIEPSPPHRHLEALALASLGNSRGNAVLDGMSDHLISEVERSRQSLAVPWQSLQTLGCREAFTELAQEGSEALLPLLLLGVDRLRLLTRDSVHLIQDSQSVVRPQCD